MRGKVKEGRRKQKKRKSKWPLSSPPSQLLLLCNCGCKKEQAKCICDANQSKGLYRISIGGERRRGWRHRRNNRSWRWWRWHRRWLHRGQIGLSCQHGHREEYPAGKFCGPFPLQFTLLFVRHTSSTSFSCSCATYTLFLLLLQGTRTFV